MTRLNEKEAAKTFIESVLNGYYKYDRSTNTEVNYKEEKEQRDTDAVKEFTKCDLFEKVKDLI